MGNQLIAEYDPPSSQYYYYTSDQINSTRIVTDGTGAVVYAAAHDPYGGIQKTWGVPTFDPVPKFSGKEHDGESGLDYFGARYYDRLQFRFISPDLISSARRASCDLQLSNLYWYCRANPLRYLDPDGADPIVFLLVREGYNHGYIYGDLYGPNGEWIAHTRELPYKNNTPYESCIKIGVYSADFGPFTPKKGPSFTTLILDQYGPLGTDPRSEISFHEGDISQSQGCIVMSGYGAVGAAVGALCSYIDGLPNQIQDVMNGFAQLDYYVVIKLSRALAYQIRQAVAFAACNMPWIL